MKNGSLSLSSFWKHNWADVSVAYAAEKVGLGLSWPILCVLCAVVSVLYKVVLGLSLLFNCWWEVLVHPPHCWAAWSMVEPYVHSIFVSTQGVIVFCTVRLGWGGPGSCSNEPHSREKSFPWGESSCDPQCLWLCVFRLYRGLRSGWQNLFFFLIYFLLKVIAL